MDAATKAKDALKACLTRAEKALAHLEQGDDAAFEEAFRSRTEAFHNFRALDHLALMDGSDLAHDPEAQKIYAMISAIDTQLAGEIEKSKTRVRGKTIRTKQIQRTLGAYHSGSCADPMFIKKA